MSTSPNPSGDPFGRLPTEILLKIIKISPSFSSLWSIVNSSQTMAILLNKFAAEIIETTIKATATGQMQELIRAVLRAQVSCRLGLEEARNLVCKKYPVPTPLSADEIQDSKSLYYFLSIAHNIHVLAHACCDHYIKASLAISPSAFIKFNRYNGDVLAWYDEAEGCSYEPRETGPPSWVEEQRVIKALWRIQFFFELNISRKAGTLDWPEDDLKTLASTSVPSFYTIRDFEIEQILTVYEFIQDLIKREGYTEDDYRLPVVPAKDSFNVKCAPTPRPLRNYREDKLHQSLVRLDAAPLSLGFWWRMSRTHNYSPLKNIPFDPYRRLGFALWDQKRMTDLGFSEPDGRALLNSEKYYYTWRSILTEEERELCDSQ
ncbi:hypothetical protein F5884DRAFT_191133 [Xylogone sp. PMI_703]|nr:hypothetical protein F5884DRAFT_191133 [Xylogone sp. PMI_703]